MAVIATLADINVTTSLFERRIGTDPFDLLDGLFHREQRHDFNNTANDDGQENTKDQNEDVLFNNMVFFKKHISFPLIRLQRLQACRLVLRYGGHP